MEAPDGTGTVGHSFHDTYGVVDDNSDQRRCDVVCGPGGNQWVTAAKSIAGVSVESANAEIAAAVTN